MAMDMAGSAPPSGAAPGRIGLLDGLRGWFLIFMSLSHMILQGGFLLQEVHFRQFLFMESAQGFIFLSGMMAGLVHGGRMLRIGFPAGRDAMLRRALQLWIWTMALTLAALLLRDLLPGGMEAWRNWLGLSGLDDGIRVAAVLAMLFQPTFMDILPQYVLYIAAAPWILRAVLRGSWPVVLAFSGMSWFLCQIGVNMLWSRPISMAIEAGDGQGMRAAFDIFGWQILFVGGLVLGGAAAAGRIDPSALLSHRHRNLAFAALCLLLALFPLRVATAHGLMPAPLIQAFAPFENRSNLSPVHLASFIAAAWLFAWAVTVLPNGGRPAGPRRRSAPCDCKPSGAAHVGAAFAPGLPVACGAGLCARWLDTVHGPFGEAGKNGLAMLLIASLWLVPLLRERLPAALRPARRQPQS